MLRRRNATGEEHRQHLSGDASHFSDSWGAQQNSEQEERAGECFAFSYIVAYFICAEQQREHEEVEAVKKLEMLSLAADDDIDLEVTFYRMLCSCVRSCSSCQQHPHVIRKDPRSTGSRTIFACRCWRPTQLNGANMDTMVIVHQAKLLV